MTDRLQETAHERHERYLRLAREARERAAHASDSATRDHYCKLATGWAALADALGDTLPRDAEPKAAERS